MAESEAAFVPAVLSERRPRSLRISVARRKFETVTPSAARRIIGGGRRVREEEGRSSSFC